MSADRCRGCGRVWSWLGLVLLAPAWLPLQLVLALVALSDARSRRRADRGRRP
jgi:hypothetical protein